jgi:hypothetical protein
MATEAVRERRRVHQYRPTRRRERPGDEMADAAELAHVGELADVAELAAQGQASEAGRLAQESAQAYESRNRTAALNRAGESQLAAAYTLLQQIVGLIALLLPFVLIAGNWWLTGNQIESSISAYYHTPMGNVFVGALCALAVFFASYNYKPLPGYNLDNKLSWIAAGAAVIVALLPTTNGGEITQSDQVVGRVHLTFAGLLFFLLAMFALFVFPQSRGGMTHRKRIRNWVYRICGVIILVAIVLVPISNKVDPPDWLHAFFWLETICVVAFGVSWLIKGGFLGILADKPST